MNEQSGRGILCLRELPLLIYQTALFERSMFGTCGCLGRAINQFLEDVDDGVMVHGHPTSSQAVGLSVCDDCCCRCIKTLCLINHFLEGCGCLGLGP